MQLPYGSIPGSKQALFYGGILLIFGVGVYVIHKVVSGVKKTAEAAGGAIGDVIVDAFDLDQPDNVVNAAYVLPNGARVDANLAPLKDDLTFVWQGVKYRVTKRRSDGLYETARA